MSEIRTKTYPQKEIRAYGDDCACCAVEHGTLAQGHDLVAGTALGLVTASGLVGPYDNTAEDGRQTCIGILAANVDTTDGPKSCAIHVRGALVESELVGLDASAKTDLNARSLFNGVLVF